MTRYIDPTVLYLKHEQSAEAGLLITVPLSQDLTTVMELLRRDVHLPQLQVVCSSLDDNQTLLALLIISKRYGKKLSC